jgi:hypothetical protein
MPRKSSLLSASPGLVNKSASSLHAKGAWRCMTLQEAAANWILCLRGQDAARAHDNAAVQTHRPGAKRNFPDEDISELPATVGEEQKQRGTSRYLGFSSNKASSSWKVLLKDKNTHTHAPHRCSRPTPRPSATSQFKPHPPQQKDQVKQREPVRRAERA